MNSLSQQVSVLVEQGRKVEARRLLAGVLQQDPENVQAWAMMADLVDNAHHEAECLHRILKLTDDAHLREWAAARLAQLESLHPSGVLPVTPPSNPGQSTAQPAAANRKALTSSTLLIALSGGLVLVLLGVFVLVGYRWLAQKNTQTAVIPTYQPTSTSAVTSRLAATSIPTDMPTSTVFPSNTPTVTPSPQRTTLAENGPWLLYLSSLPECSDHCAVKSLNIVNQDGSAPTQLIMDPGIRRFVVGGKAASGQALVAYITVTRRPYPVGTYYWGGELHLLEIPGGSNRLITNLVNDQLRLPVEHNTSTGETWPVDLSVGGYDSLAWSPDGKTLAFVGAIDEPIGDIYLYDVETDAISRLTHGPGHASQPVWSPDGKYIVYVARQRAGYGTPADSAIIATTVDGAHTIKSPQEKPSNPGYSTRATHFVTWLADDTVIVHEWFDGCAQNLRALNVDTGASVLYWEGCFTTGDIDPETRVVVLGFDERNGTESPDGQPGVFLLDGTRPATRISGLEIPDDSRFGNGTYSELTRPNIQWIEQIGMFLILSRTSAPYQYILLKPSGELVNIDLPDKFSPEFSPDGTRIARGVRGEYAEEAQKGLWVGAFGQAASPAFPYDAYSIVWLPDSTGLFFVSGGVLHHLSLINDMSVTLLDVVQFSGGLAWVP